MFGAGLLCYGGGGGGGGEVTKITPISSKMNKKIILSIIEGMKLLLMREG